MTSPPSSALCHKPKYPNNIGRGDTMSRTSFRERGRGLAEGLEPYVGGLTHAQAAQALGIEPSDLIKLSSNENPLGASPAVSAAIERTLASVPYYPTSVAHELHEAIGRYLGVSADQVVSASGSST